MRLDQYRAATTASAFMAGIIFVQARQLSESAVTFGFVGESNSASQDDRVARGLRAIGQSLEEDVLSPEAVADFNRAIASDLAQPTLEPQLLPEWQG
ncbi:MAG: hypothetical protein K2Y37_14335 [Pirellulales bacterium]|nr:hypothetical protein [Pirellulales bacterium]